MDEKCSVGNHESVQRTGMKTDERTYKTLYEELEQYEENGIEIMMDGDPATPLQIVTAYMTKEEGTYMRDYEISPEGNIESLSFTYINEYERCEITP